MVHENQVEPVVEFEFNVFYSKYSITKTDATSTIRTPQSKSKVMSATGRKFFLDENI